ncbi:MAG TPA: efflux RND transporter periplasmic adaptor subunit [Ramlibacter sp.]|jgi:RND family efflux transporter MFP subunit|nr:efflux RND transporter periplasmic adaptor subunit [Ramlibacter sp.]
MSLSSAKRLLALCCLATSTCAVAQDYDCMVEARQAIEIRSPVEGLIDRVLVQRGDIVTRGQVLAVIESSVERATLEVAKMRAAMDGEIKVAEARVQLNAKKVERARDLHQQKFVSDSALDEAEAEFRLASEELRRTRENQRLAQTDATRASAALDIRTIRSPFTGVVVEVLLRQGELAATATVKNPLMKLAEIDPLHVEVVLPSRLFGSIRRGQLATVQPEAPVQGSYQSVVKVVDRVVDAASGTFGVRLELPNRQGKVPAGIRCRVRF